MCGIVGWSISSKKTHEVSVLEKMLLGTQHRGPDDAGTFQDRKNGFALGHNRLSIIDLSDRGHQPMCNERTGDVLVFNGEIYNYRELREQLKQAGYRFQSDSDTEVLLHCLAEWGMGCLDRLKGMFAFAYWSKEEGILHLVRDPMGIKPLYIWQLPGNEGIVFASEVKAFFAIPEFRHEVDRTSLKQFLEFGYTFNQSQTIFKDVSKLPPGHRLEVRKGQPGQAIRYFSPVQAQQVQLDRQELEEQLFNTLSKVVGEHLVADVPVGLLLSGGLDSSILAALAAKAGPLHTYSMGFAGSKVDERPQARLVSDFIGTEHEEILIQPEELLTDLEDTVRHFDDLFADWGMISTRLLYKKCREKGIKVVIVGEGSDELFGGYDIFRHALPENEKKPMEWRLFQLYRSYAGRRYGNQYLVFRSRMKEYLAMTNGDLFGAIRLFETRDQLPNNYVMKVDKASMAISVEARVPFLDSRVAEIAYKVPGEMLIDQHDEKMLLRSMAKRYELLPPEILKRKKFGAGIDSNWMDSSESFRSFSRDIILEKNTWVDEMGLRKPMKAYFDQGQQGYKFPHQISIFRNLAWRLLILNLWSRSYGVSPV